MNNSDSPIVGVGHDAPIYMVAAHPATQEALFQSIVSFKLPSSSSRISYRIISRSLLPWRGVPFPMRRYTGLVRCQMHSLSAKWKVD